MRGFIVMIVNKANTDDKIRLMTIILNPLYFFASEGPAKRRITVGMINIADMVPYA